MTDKTILLFRTLDVGLKNDFTTGTISRDTQFQINITSPIGINIDPYICDRQSTTYNKKVPGSWQIEESKTTIGLNNKYEALCLLPPFITEKDGIKDKKGVIVTRNLPAFYFAIAAAPKESHFQIYNGNYLLTITNLYATYYLKDLTPAEIVATLNYIKDNVFGYTGQSTEEMITNFKNDTFPYFCSLQSKNPVVKTDPLSGEPIPNYSSYFRSGDELGLQCRLWETNSETNPKVLDQSKITYCKNFPDSYECACINNTTNKYYTSFSNPNKTPLQCWYGPCNVKSTNQMDGFQDYTYLVPTTIQNTTCPTETGVIFNPDNPQNLTQAQAKLYYKPISGHDPVPPPPDNKTFWQKYGTYIIIGIVILIIIIIIIIVVLMYRKKKRQKEINAIIMTPFIPYDFKDKPTEIIEPIKFAEDSNWVPFKDEPKKEQPLDSKKNPYFTENKDILKVQLPSKSNDLFIESNITVNPEDIF